LDFLVYCFSWFSFLGCHFSSCRFLRCLANFLGEIIVAVGAIGLFIHLLAPALWYLPAALGALDPVCELHPKPGTTGSFLCLIDWLFLWFGRGRGLGPGGHVQVAFGAKGPDTHFLVLVANYFFLAKRTPSLFLLENHRDRNIFLLRLSRRFNLYFGFHLLGRFLHQLLEAVEAEGPLSHHPVFLTGYILAALFALHNIEAP
jgi:hypothetical protein